MATFRFLDPPKSPIALLREQRFEANPAAAQSQVERFALRMLGILAILVGAVLLTFVAMIGIAKQKSLAEGHGDLVVESISLRDRPGLVSWANCWSGSTLNLVVRVRNHRLTTPTTSPMSVKLASMKVAGSPEDAPGYQPEVETTVLPGSAMPRPGHTIDVPISVNVPAWMQDKPLAWSVDVIGGDDLTPHGDNLSTIVTPCGKKG